MISRKMEFDVLDSLDDLGYTGVLKSDEDVLKAIEIGAKSPEFTLLVEWLTKELQALYGLDCCVNPITDTNDASCFLLEVSSFLKELNCPYKQLLEGPISQHLPDVKSRRILLDYLTSELQTARLLHCRKGESSVKPAFVEDALKALHISSDFNADPTACLAEVEEKVKVAAESRPIPIPVFQSQLTAEQWETLDALFRDLSSEYATRRKLLITRLDLTLQSFKWGVGNKSKEKKILEAYLSHRKSLKEEPAVNLCNLLAANESLLIVEKPSSAKFVKNAEPSVKTFLMNDVPDRGGRPKEMRPPVEMPSWAKRAPGGGHGDSSRGGWSRGKKRFKDNQGSKKDKKGAFDAAGSY